MKTLYLSHTAQPSGAELALQITLTAARDEDDLVLFGAYGPIQTRLEEAGVATRVVQLPDAIGDFNRHNVRFSRNLWGVTILTLRYLKELEGIVRQLAPDVIVSNSSKSHFLGFYLSARLRLPLVSVVRDRVTKDFYSTLGVALLRGGLRAIPAGLIANSASTAATVPRTWRKAQLRAVVPSPVPSPVSARPSAPHSKDAANRVRVGMVARLAPWKGQHVAIEAFSRAFPHGQAELHLLGGALFGESAYEESLHRQVAALGLQSFVTFHGHVDDVYAHMADWDIFVHASVIPEPFGQVVVQAMHMSLPTVAAAAGGPLETITDGVDGVLYPPGDVEALANVMRRLAGDPHLRSRLGSEAMRSARRYLPGVLAPAFRAAVLASVGHRAGTRKGSDAVPGSAAVRSTGDARP